MKRIYILFLFICCFCRLSAEEPSFAFCDYSQGKVFIMENGTIVWEHNAPDSNDLWILPNKNILFTTGKGVLEVTRKNDTVFHYISDSHIFACQRLKNGNTFIGECNNGRLLEVSPSGKIVRQVSILPDGEKDGGHGFMRNARCLDNGNYLVAHYGGKSVCEYDKDGKIVWSIPVPGGAHSVMRLPNGNTLVAATDKDKDPGIFEYDLSGNIIWSLTNKDLEGAPLKFAGGMHYLSDGRLFLSNWVGHANSEKSIHLFVVDKSSKKILYTVADRKEIKTISSVFALDALKKRIKSYH